jgi:hypothetical protein
LSAATSGPIRGVELGDLGREVLVAAGQGAQRQDGGGGRVGGGAAVGAAGGALGDQFPVAQSAQAGAQGVGGGDDQRLHLGLGLGAGRYRAAAGHPQAAQGVGRPAAGLGDPDRTPGLGGAGGGLGVDRVGLAPVPAGRAVRAVDLDQLHPRGLQVMRQPGTVGPGALHPDPGQRPEATQPTQQPRVAGRGGRELPVPQQPAGEVQDSGSVGVAVRVHPTGHLPTGQLPTGRVRAGLLDGIGVCHRGHVVLCPGLS